MDIHHIIAERLAVAPVSCHGTIDKTILLAIALPFQVIEHLLHAVEHRHAAYHFLQQTTVTRLADILAHGLYERGLLIGLYGVLESYMDIIQCAIIGMIVSPSKVFLDHIAVYTLAIGLLHRKKHQ